MTQGPTAGVGAVPNIALKETRSLLLGLLDPCLTRTVRRTGNARILGPEGDKRSEADDR